VRLFRPVRSQAPGPAVAARHRTAALSGRAAAREGDADRGRATRDRGFRAGAGTTGFAPRGVVTPGASPHRTRRGTEGSDLSLSPRGNVVSRHRFRSRGPHRHRDDLAPPRSRAAQEDARDRDMTPDQDEDERLTTLLRAIPSPGPAPDFLA